MNSVFGLQMDTLMWVFGVTFTIVIALIVYAAIRNPILLKLGTRYIWRRPGRTALIVVGLMLGTTIITAALGTGDSISHTIRSAVVDSLGGTDEVISSSTESDVELTGESVQLDYFPQSYVDEVRRAVGGSSLVDGVAPLILENIAIQNPAQRQSEPRAVLLASTDDLTDFTTLRLASGGGSVAISDLGDGEVFLNEKGARELRAKPGDTLAVYTQSGVADLRVRDIVRDEGVGTTDSPAVVMPLAAAQQLLDKPGLIKHIVVSNRGGPISGARHSDAVDELLRPTVERLGLGMELTKKEDMATADEVANAFTEFFVIFGTFSIVAGILLIFLIFVMLSAERRSEMGMARAIGAERSHLVRMFVFEGLAYDIVAAAAGALLGMAVAFGMIYMMGRAFAEMGLDFKFNVSTRSLIVAYTIGVVLTFIVVTVSAWQVSLLNVVAAIRNLPESKAPGQGKRGLLFGLLVLGFSVLLIYVGLSAKQAAPFNLGVSLAFLSTVPIMRRLGVNERICYTLPGVALVIWWLLPWEALDWLLPDMAMDFSIFVLSGLMVVTGTTWVLIYNSDLLLGTAMAVFGRLKWLAPALKTSISYPLKNRFRTGVTLAMFTLVVFTLVVGSTTVTAFTNAFNNVGLYGGGYDIHATALRANPIGDVNSGLRQAGIENEFEGVAGLSVAVIEARQSDTSNDFESYALRGLDATFLQQNTYQFGAIAEGYSSASQVWSALQNDPHLAVIDAVVVPHRDKFGLSGALPDFSLEGFYVEDGTFAPVPVEVRDPRTGHTVSLTIIGVLQDVAPNFMLGISTSQALLQSDFPDQAEPVNYLFKTRPGVDTGQASDSIEAAFFANGMESETIKSELDDVVGLNRTFNYIMQGFMGLGLVVGVAALGVISARAVVERRHEIGVMRAIGFERTTVQIAFLLESSFVAVVGILFGTGLALVVAYNVIHDASTQPSWQSITFAVPWLNLVVIFAVVYGAALLTSFLPARQASRTYPAAALRYQ